MILPPKELSYLDAEFDRAYRALSDHEVGSEEYQKALEVVSKLHKLKQEEKASGFSKDALLMAGTNILGILLIIKHEHVEIITSRAMQLLSKTR